MVSMRISSTEEHQKLQAKWKSVAQYQKNALSLLNSTSLELNSTGKARNYTKKARNTGYRTSTAPNFTGMVSMRISSTEEHQKLKAKWESCHAISEKRSFSTRLHFSKYSINCTGKARNYTKEARNSGSRAFHCTKFHKNGLDEKLFIWRTM